MERGHRDSTNPESFVRARRSARCGAEDRHARGFNRDHTDSVVFARINSGHNAPAGLTLVTREDQRRILVERGARREAEAPSCVFSRARFVWPTCWHPKHAGFFLSLRFQVGRWQNSIPRFSLDPAGCMTLALSTMPAGSVLSPA